MRPTDVRSICVKVKLLISSSCEERMRCGWKRVSGLESEDGEEVKLMLLVLMGGSPGTDAGLSGEISLLCWV